nr:IS1 family transposase [Escherichia coli]
MTSPLNSEGRYTEGEGGLKRVVKKEHADGSITRSEYDEAGRLKAQTDARLGRKLLSFSKSVELHDKVIGHYLNIKHYQ